MLLLKKFHQELQKNQFLKNFYKNRGINLVKTGNKWSFRTSSGVKEELVIFKKQKRKLLK